MKARKIEIHHSMEVPVIDCPHCKVTFAIMYIQENRPEENAYGYPDNTWMWQVAERPAIKYKPATNVYCYACGKSVNS